MKSHATSDRKANRGDPLVAALKKENLALHKRLAKFTAQNISLKNQVAALKSEMKKGRSDAVEDLGEKLRRARERVSKAT